jgi:hypothetical protein
MQHARVRQGEAGLVQGGVTVHQHIKVQRARRIAVGPLPAGRSFNGLQRSQQSGCA